MFPFPTPKGGVRHTRYVLKTESSDRTTDGSQRRRSKNEDKSRIARSYRKSHTLPPERE